MAYDEGTAQRVRDAAALSRPHAREMDFTGKALKGFIYVDSEAVSEDQEFNGWIIDALDFVYGLPPK